MIHHYVSPQKTRLIRIRARNVLLSQKGVPPQHNIFKLCGSDLNWSTPWVLLLVIISTSCLSSCQELERNQQQQQQQQWQWTSKNIKEHQQQEATFRNFLKSVFSNQLWEIRFVESFRLGILDSRDWWNYSSRAVPYFWWPKSCTMMYHAPLEMTNIPLLFQPSQLVRPIVSKRFRCQIVVAKVILVLPHGHALLPIACILEWVPPIRWHPKLCGVKRIGHRWIVGLPGFCSTCRFLPHHRSMRNRMPKFCKR